MGTHGHMYRSPQPKSFEELSKWLQQPTFSLSTVWDVLNSHQVAMDNLHAAQMELNRTIEETHHLQSSQSVLLQVLEAKFGHFITDHWHPMQTVVQHSRVYLPCTCPLHLAAQRPSPSPTSSGCLSGPLYPNAPSALFCAFPRLASPTSSTYPIGCLSPT